MCRRILVGLVVALFLMFLGNVWAQQPKQQRKIGYLGLIGSPDASKEAFRQGLRDLGYLEGQNIVVEYRSGASRARLTELASELVRQNVDLIVAVGGAAPAAKLATGTVPIVFLFSGDPIQAGLVDSLVRPGKNLTGITWLAFDLVGKRLEILKDAVPQISRVAVVASPAHPGEQRELKETQNAARALGITLQYNQVNNTADVEIALRKAIEENAHALLLFPDPVTNAHRKQITEFAAKHRLPSMFGRKEPVESGGLLSYGPQLEDVYRRIPAHVDKILKGAKPSDIPVELPMRFELVVNLKTAKVLGLTMPPEIMVQATQVIQ
jgi:putative ABC transport system substrate-binding protein